MIEIYTADPAVPRASGGGSRRLGLRVLRSEGKSKSYKPALNQLYTSSLLRPTGWQRHQSHRMIEDGAQQAGRAVFTASSDDQAR